MTADWMQALAVVGGFVVALATAVGVFMAYWQLRQSAQHARTAFEDRLSEQYRAIMALLPVEALLGEELTSEMQHRYLSVFYRYFDLSNEQIFLRDSGRIRKGTWADWEEGILQNLALPAFKQSWDHFRRRRPECFDELAQLLRDRSPEPPV